MSKVILCEKCGKKLTTGDNTYTIMPVPNSNREVVNHCICNECLNDILEERPKLQLSHKEKAMKLLNNYFILN